MEMHVHGWDECVCDFFFFFFFHDIIAVTLSWSEAFDLTGVGPYSGHPQPPYRLGMALIPPTPFQTERPCNLQNGPFGSESSALSLLKYHAGCERTTWHSLAKKQAPVFIIRNICVVIPCAVIALSTGNRISPLLRRVSSPPASQDIYCYCHNDLIEAKEPFVGLDPFALQIRAPVQGWLHLTRDFQGLLQLSNIG